MITTGDVTCSFSAKELISKLLVVDPANRIKIEDVMRHQWLMSHRQLPTLPLGSADILTQERPSWADMRVRGGCLSVGLIWSLTRVDS